MRFEAGVAVECRRSKFVISDSHPLREPFSNDVLPAVGGRCTKKTLPALNRFLHTKHFAHLPVLSNTWPLLSSPRGDVSQVEMVDANTEKGERFEIHAGVANKEGDGAELLVGKNNESAFPQQRRVFTIAGRAEESSGMTK